MTVYVLAAAAFVLACIPALLFAINAVAFRPLPRHEVGRPPPRVSLLIPARNEEGAIADAVACALRSEDVELELIVMDDHSDDRTSQRVLEAASGDPRVRLAEAPPLPPGWCGKQHACFALAQLASHDLLAWADADVRLRPDALRRMADAIARRDVGLLSGFPRQLTGTWLERLTIPLIHFVLLGYLPMPAMRWLLAPSLGAGCGQLVMARRAAYVRSGGHEAIRGSMHDGIQLPRAFRRAGIMTDLFDATDVAECRMYRSAAEVWRGLMKNAREGMASPGAIVPWTIILAMGQVLPAALTAFLLWQSLTPHGLDAQPYGRDALTLSVAAWGLGVAVRAVSAVRYRQSWVGVVGHPAGVSLLLIIQWHSLFAGIAGSPTAWRGREYCAPWLPDASLPSKPPTALS